MRIALSVALGGGAGALARYYLSKLIEEHFPLVLPLGTLVVNLAGSLFIGFVAGFFNSVVVSAEIKTFVSIGFLGAFTTFSTFTLENIRLFQAGEVKFALLNIIVSNVGGLLAVLAGILAANLIFKKGGAL
jgi:CrcB protein